MCRNINIILRKLDINLNEFLILNERTVKKRCKEINKIEPDWRVGVIFDLLGCRDGIQDCGLSQNEVEEILKSVCTD